MAIKQTKEPAQSFSVSLTGQLCDLDLSVYSLAVLGHEILKVPSGCFFHESLALSLYFPSFSLSSSFLPQRMSLLIKLLHFIYYICFYFYLLRVLFFFSAVFACNWRDYWMVTDFFPISHLIAIPNLNWCEWDCW